MVLCKAPSFGVVQNSSRLQDFKNLFELIYWMERDNQPSTKLQKERMNGFRFYRKEF
jgi:hypothetical protein